jgi:hypothetical protein
MRTATASTPNETPNNKAVSPIGIAAIRISRGERPAIAVIKEEDAGATTPASRFYFTP